MAKQNPLIGLLGDGAPSPEHSLVLLGHGALVPIPELVGFLGSHGVDGVLKVGTGKEQYVLEFSGGQVVHGEASRGPRLFQADHATSEPSVDALRAQIQELVCRLFRGEPKSFTFWQGPTLHAHHGVRLNPTSLLLEGARVHDETDEVPRDLEPSRPELAREEA